MQPPRPAVSAWLESAFPGSTLTPIPGDASTRAYFRLVLPDRSSLVVMDYGAPFEGESDDVRLARLFREASLPVARVRRVCGEVGCLILDDLGTRTLESVLAESEAAEVEEAYRQAVALAVAVAVRGTPVLARSDRAGGPALDRSRLRFEMDFFVRHFVLGLRGLGSVPEGLEEDLHLLADRAADSSSPVLCHRDFHARNLLVREDGSLAMVDIQDACWGPDTYDLASLLRDAYADLPDCAADELAEAYRLALPVPPPPERFRRRLEVVSAQRMIKALGTFGYQVSVLHRPRYLEGIPRTLDRLARRLPTCADTARLGRRLESSGLLTVAG